MTSLKALLVQQRNATAPDLMDEFEALAETAGYTVIGRFDIVGSYSSRYAIGSGKVAEIAEWIEVEQPDVVLFSPMLKSSQIYRLMEAWNVEVRDRTQVILEIFDKHAKTVQAKLQIEEARLRYELPFIRHQLRMRLQREHTGARPIGEQIGAGEDILNLRIMEIRQRIARIRSKLNKIMQIQELKKKRREKEGFTEIALAGYTNAGKSTLHRALTDSSVEVANQFFTTLSTKTAMLRLGNRRVVLSDSVGFISNLPRSLLQAFNTTLMEIGSADVILLVVDGSDPLDEICRKAETCLNTFTKVGITGIPLVTALNKIDLLISADEIQKRITALSSMVNTVVPISAKESYNLDTLLIEIEKHLPKLTRFHLSIPYDNNAMSLVSWIHSHGTVCNQQFNNDVIELEVQLASDIAWRLHKMLPKGSLRRLN